MQTPIKEIIAQTITKIINNEPIISLFSPKILSYKIIYHKIILFQMGKKNRLIFITLTFAQRTPKKAVAFFATAPKENLIIYLFSLDDFLLSSQNY